MQRTRSCQAVLVQSGSAWSGRRPWVMTAYATSKPSMSSSSRLCRMTAAHSAAPDPTRPPLCAATAGLGGVSKPLCHGDSSALSSEHDGQFLQVASTGSVLYKI